ncbi:hypothetical protein H2201_008936 [Coniosporium apollinis]|uniref:Transcription initiation factor TFIID subunit 8 n=1 Tax=Coniosporium apollinis TaxID=61459 RepID=A0ABQ9NF18_9PEZI|nr:hypothetical protein H2201_008936 [Coniosporium apollinis]
MKRSAPEVDSLAHAKRRRIQHHALRHKQPSDADTSLAPQDPLFVQSQLLRAISISLSAVGFDSVKPSALEAFRAEVEEYMLRFLSHARQSMTASRRTQPTPADFARALTQQGIPHSTSLFRYLDSPIPPSVLLPAIPPPPPAEPPPPDLDPVLGPKLAGTEEKAKRRYIPAHFPNLPSKHTWQAEPVFTARETDPRRIRERATEEGVLAEQALRKLMAASKSGHQVRRRVSSDKRSEEVWKETLKAVMQEDEENRRRTAEDEDYGWDGTVDLRPGEDSRTLEPGTDGVLVNYESRYWRRGAQGR